jgi:hypothetical protein
MLFAYSRWFGSESLSNEFRHFESASQKLENLYHRRTAETIVEVKNRGK